MAEVIDYSKLPATLTITNTNKATYATDAGSDVWARHEVVKYEDVKDEIEAGLPFEIVSYKEGGTAEDLEYVRIIRKYKSTDRQVKFYWTNTGKVLAAGDSIKVVAKTSAAVAHYMSYNGRDGLKVEADEE